VDTAINLVTIICAVTLIGVILLQAKGSAFNSGFGGDSSVQKTRRGFEKTLFDFTIVTAVVFVIFAIISSFALSA
jgi:preprotein translocase subunit SecG